MSHGVLHDFDSALSVVGDDIASDVGLAVGSIDDDSVESALLNLIPPDQRH